MGRPTKRVVVFKIPVQRNLVPDLRRMFDVASKQYGSLENFVAQIVESEVVSHRMRKISERRLVLSQRQRIEELSRQFLTSEQIAARLGLDLAVVRRAVHQLREVDA